MALLSEGADFTLTTRDVSGDEHEVSVSLPSLPRDVRRGNVIFLDDGAIQLKVVGISETDVKCKVVVGGALRAGKGINIPGVTLSTPSLTERDVKHMLFGIEQAVDFIALSFVRSGDDVLQAQRILRERGAEIPLIAKIEKHEAVSNMDQILDVADGVMVARGDLGIEIPIQKVPLVQKELIRKCNRRGKPVIVATQMLESMISSAAPTRAEVTDVANAIFDGTDAIMLSAETAIGRYPIRAVRMMSRIAVETEAPLPYKQILMEKGADLEPETDDAISYDACHTAQQLKAAAIIAFTTSGSTAQRVSRYRPQAPILAITHNDATRKRLALSWGVYPFEVAEPSKLEDLFAAGVRLALETGVAKSGDLIVITGGVPIGVPGSTNLLRVERIK
jgi:pyruvate kinase